MTIVRLKILVLVDIALSQRGNWGGLGVGYGVVGF